MLCWTRGRPTALALAVLAGLTVPAAADTDRDAFVDAGAVLLGQAEVAALFSDTTFYGEVWTAYYGPDGRKITVIGGRTIERRWWVSEDGAVCQTLNRTEETACGPAFYVLDETYRSFNADGSLRVVFTAAAGNPEGL